MTIKQRIKELIKEENIKQVEFANRIHVDASYISKLLSKTSNATPSDRLINDICREFNIRKEWLLEGSGEMYIVSKEDDALAEALAEITLSENEQLKQLVTKLLKLNDVSLDSINNLIDVILNSSNK